MEIVDNFFILWTVLVGFSFPYVLFGEILSTFGRGRFQRQNSAFYFNASFRNNFDDDGGSLFGGEFFRKFTFIHDALHLGKSCVFVTDCLHHEYRNVFNFETTTSKPLIAPYTNPIFKQGRRNEDARMSFLGVFSFTAPYLPWVMLTFSVLLGHSVIVDVIGIFVGHTYYFFEYVYPIVAEIRGWKIKRLLEPPMILHWLCGTYPEFIRQHQHQD